MLDTSPLFAPFDLGPLKLSNRIVMAPMTRQRSPDMTPGPDVAAYYARRAAGGVGLIITEGTTIDDPASTPDATIPGFHGGGLEGLERGPSGRACGRWPDHASAMASGHGASRSDLSVAGRAEHRPIRSRIHRQADRRADDAGAHRGRHRLVRPCGGRRPAPGLRRRGAAWRPRLSDRPVLLGGTNRRADAWGGDDLASRARFGAEIVRAVRGAVGPDFPILLRWSQWKTGDYAIKLVREPGALAGFLEPLVDAGVTAFHCSTRRFWEPEFPDSGSHLNLAGWTKKVTGLPVITVGSVGLSRADAVTERKSEVESTTAHLDELAAMVERGEVDLVAVGRALLANPEWPRLVRENRFGEVASYNARALEDLV